MPSRGLVGLSCRREEKEKRKRQQAAITFVSLHSLTLYCPDHRLLFIRVSSCWLLHRFVSLLLPFCSATPCLSVLTFCSPVCLPVCFATACLSVLPLCVYLLLSAASLPLSSNCLFRSHLTSLAPRSFSLFLLSTPPPRLLRSMGWREGQGVGERHRPARQSGILPETEDDDSERAALDFAAHLGVTFAPRDVAVAAQTAKDNLHGIGYTGISAKDFHLDVSGGRRPMGGIGVGVFEEEDEDIYGEDDLSRYDR